MGIAVGIDLGTTNSCVARFANDRCDIIVNDLGNRTTPSIVAFNNKERLFGDVAKDQIALNPANTVYDVKRLIGRRFADPEVRHDMRHLQYKVFEQSGKPMVEVKFKEELKVFSPEEISSMVLEKMKEVAETSLGERVTDAVVTVPAYFNNSQRQATKDAAKMAGLNVLRIINEPTAAAITYGMNKVDHTKSKQIVLIFDLGGGTFDLSLLTIDKGVFRVMATAGDTHLGGEDFNSRLVNHFIAEFKRKTSKDITGNLRALRRLRSACERVKIRLSSLTEASFQIDCLFEEIDLDTSITRAKFEEVCDDLFKITMNLTQKVLENARIDKLQVNEIVLVGGSTRIPKIQNLISTYFGKKPNHSVNPDEAVAYGAGVQAAILSGDSSALIRSLDLRDVTPLSLGVKKHLGLVTTLIPRNSVIPIKVTKRFTTHRDHQTVVLFLVFEGDRAQSKDNNFLGKCMMLNIPPVLRGVPSFAVTFDLDINGILNVSALDRSTGKTQEVAIDYYKERSSQDEIDRMIVESKMYKEEDEAVVARVSARVDLEKYLYFLKNSFNPSSTNNISHFEQQILEKEIDDSELWLQNSQAASQDDFVAHHKALKLVVDPIIFKEDNRNPEVQIKAEADTEIFYKGAYSVEEVDLTCA
ncbi:Hsp70 family protein [Kocuria palustris]|nr:Hsp70 family protein [Kocuria palustris]